MLQLLQSYIRDAAIPGKVAAFARQLAQKHANQPITRAAVHDEFHNKTGLSPQLFDDSLRLDREQVAARMREKIVGQDAAVEAAVDVVMVAKARLADPSRPLTTMLFLGPTGVGKTQCAKALTEVMFSEPSRLLRLDMNEFVAPHSPARLLGTFDDPDGLLTSAVRRQPFSVVLLDEIEKAHPDVFDLLLQVLGEGRLTDGLGRTTDFSNTVLVMTSNLGTTASQGQVGLNPDARIGEHAFVRAAESFFRPEFFNRIDRVIPFETLSRDQMRRIANLLLADVFQRDGLVRRRCAIAVEPLAMERIVDAGYHPQFGARALKRAIERQLVQPVAASLAGVKPELPALIGVYPSPEGVAAVVHPLESVPAAEMDDAAELQPVEELARAERFVRRMEQEIESARPDGAGSVSREQFRYYGMKEQLHRIGELLNLVRGGVAAAADTTGPAALPHPAGASYKSWLQNSAKLRDTSARPYLRSLRAATDIHEYLVETARSAVRPGELEAWMRELREEAALLQSFVEMADSPDRALLILQPVVGGGDDGHVRLGALLEEGYMLLGFDVESHCPAASSTSAGGLLLSGPGVWPLALSEAGVHIFCRRHENLLPVLVSVTAGSDDTAARQIAAVWQQRETWLAELSAGRASAAEDPRTIGKIVRFYDEGGATLDLRTGRSIAMFPAAEQWKSLLLAGLPLPAEWRE